MKRESENVGTAKSIAGGTLALLCVHCRCARRRGRPIEMSGPSKRRAAAGGRNVVDGRCTSKHGQDRNMCDQPVALVTGANQGIGLQIAKELAAKNFTVLVGSRDFARVVTD